MPASGYTAVGRTHRRHSGSRRSAPPLRPHRRVAGVSASIASTADRTPPSVQHVCVAVNHCRCQQSLEHWSAYGEDSHPRWRLWTWSLLSSFRLFGRHRCVGRGVGDSSEEERRERQVVRASDLIAFGHSGCRGGICKEHVVGFVRHKRLFPDVGRRVATEGRCQPAHGVHSLNERGH